MLWGSWLVSTVHCVQCSVHCGQVLGTPSDNKGMSTSLCTIASVSEYQNMFRLYRALVVRKLMIAIIDTEL